MGWFMRHLHSTAVENNTYYGAASPPSEKGVAQLPYMAQMLRSLRIDGFVCSPMIRAATIISDSDLPPSPAAADLRAALAEWPRAHGMEGRDNDEPDVAEYLRDRARRFGPGETVHPGEESFKETEALMIRLEAGLVTHGAWLRSMLKLNRPVRLGIITHGNRYRQWDAYQNANGDPELFALFFKINYSKKGFETASITPPWWYGNFFRDTAPGWNKEEGMNWYLPPELHESEI